MVYMTVEDSKRIREIIYRLLTRREHSQYELVRKLQQRGFEAGSVYEEIQKFESAGIQSDARFAEGFARQRVSKGHGESRIRAELKDRQVANELINFAIEDLRQDWFELAKAVHDKKYGNQKASEWKEQQKRFRYLQYRGFDQEQIHYACQTDN